MSSFKEASQVRISLKMKLSQYAWYHSSVVTFTQDGYNVLILVKHMDNNIRKIISPVIDGVSVKIEVN